MGDHSFEENMRALDEKEKAKEAKILITSPSGATSRSEVKDYELCPEEAINAIIDRFTDGMKKGHARDNWKKGYNDPEFIQTRIHHAMKHLLKIIHHRGTYEDVKAVMCNIAMVTWWFHNGEGLEQAFPEFYWKEQEIIDVIKTTAGPRSGTGISKGIGASDSPNNPNLVK